MLKINEIKINQFEEKIYDRYIKIFPEEEQREWSFIRKSYNKGIEKFYEITNDNTIIGFIMLEKLDNNPYYIDYFAIYEEYQNKGYGTKILKILVDEIVKNDGLCAEVECVEYSKDDVERNVRISRLNFYKRLNFILESSIYKLYGVYYSPIIYTNNKISKKELDDILFSYYNFNCGINGVKNNCFIIK